MPRGHHHRYKRRRHLPHPSLSMISLSLFILFDFFSFNIRLSLSFFCCSLNDLENSCEVNDDDGTPMGSGSNIVDEKWIFNQVSE